MSPLFGQYAPKVSTMAYRNHFAPHGAVRPIEIFHSQTMDGTRLSTKSNVAALNALRMETGPYRFAIVNAMKRTDRTYQTYDDPEMIDDESTE